MRSFQKTMAGIENIGRFDKDRPKTGINSYIDLYANYCQALQNNYDYEDVKKFSEVVLKLNALDQDTQGTSTLRMKNWKPDEIVDAK